MKKTILLIILAIMGCEGRVHIESKPSSQSQLPAPATRRLRFVHQGWEVFANWNHKDSNPTILKMIKRPNASWGIFVLPEELIHNESGSISWIDVYGKEGGASEYEIIEIPCEVVDKRR